MLKYCSPITNSESIVLCFKVKNGCRTLSKAFLPAKIDYNNDYPIISMKAAILVAFFNNFFYRMLIHKGSLVLIDG